MSRVRAASFSLLLAAALTSSSVSAAPEEDKAAVAALDLEYQAAVKRNDAAMMDRILHPQYYLVLGGGKVVSREALIASARNKDVVYEVQDEEPGTQTVRIWGDTAVVTAKLWIKGTAGGKPMDLKLWFSDTYVRTPEGWKYAFAQASLPLPQEVDGAAKAQGKTMEPG